MLSRSMWDDYISIVAILLSIISLISVRRGVTSQAKKDALKLVEQEIKDLNVKLEEEVKKLQKGLDVMLKERVSLKEEITALRKALNKANILVEELKDDV